MRPGPLLMTLIVGSLIPGDRALYVFCLGPDRIEVANGGFPSLVGVSADTIKDAKGNPLGQGIWDAAGKGEGSLEYQWRNPVSGKTEAKISFVEKVGDDAGGVGAYNPAR